MDGKFMRRYESFQKSLDALSEAKERDISPREVLRKSYQAEIICGEVWMEMLKVRNSLAHDYDGEIIKQHCRRIVDVYIDKFYLLRDKVELLLQD